MTEEKWEDLKENIRDKFGIIDEKREPDILTDDLGNEIKGEKESVVFNGPAGKMLLTKTTRPVIIDKKQHYHKTQAGKALTEYIASDSEFSIKVEAFTWDEIAADWKPIVTRADKISF